MALTVSVATNWMKSVKLTFEICLGYPLLLATTNIRQLVGETFPDVGS